MNLADQFQPLDPPPDGLRRVHRAARRRSVTNHLSKGAGLLVLLLVVTVAPIAASGYFETSAEIVSGATASRSESGAPAALDSIQPNADSLAPPEESAGRSTALWLALLVAGVLTMVVTTAVSVLRTHTPLLRFRRQERAAYAVGALLMVAASALAVLNG